MKFPIFLYLMLVGILTTQAQNSGKFSLEANYGLNGNFFVRSYDELGGPQNKTYFYSKNFVGSVGGMELKYHLSNNSSLILGFARTANKAEKNFAGNINGVDIFINHFNLRHHNDFYQLAYERNFKKSNPGFKYHLGIVYSRTHQQEITIEDFDNLVRINERDYENYNLEEAGVFGGFHFTKKIDTKFEAGIRVRGYYLISVMTFEAITLTPTLTYTF